MSGLIALFVLGFWGLIVYSVSFFLVKKIKVNSIRMSLQVAIAVLLFVLPVADEIVGGFQFRALCSHGAILVIDEKSMQGKTVVYKNIEDTKINGYFVPIIESHEAYKTQL